MRIVVLKNHIRNEKKKPEANDEKYRKQYYLKWQLFYPAKEKMFHFFC